MELVLNKPTGTFDENGEEKTIENIFVAKAPKGRMVRKAFQIIENVDMSSMKTSDLDNMVGYIVELYGNQFTIDDVYDGIEAADLLPTLINCIQNVAGKVGEKLDQFPNAQPGR